MATPEAGRELDGLIAEKVMGWTEVQPDRRSGVVGHPPDWHHPSIVFTTPPAYSSDVAAAWLVADLFDEMDLRHGPSGWLCRLERGDDDHVQHGDSGWSESAPLAICRAALQSVGVGLPH